MVRKEPLYPHVPKGKLPPTVTGPASLKKFAVAAQLAEEAGRLQHEVERLRGKTYSHFPNEDELDKRCSDAVDALSDAVVLLLLTISQGGR